MNNQNRIPPKSAERFLSWFIKGELLEEILGDLDEYHEELLDKPNWKRKLFYWFHVFNFLRPFAIKKSRLNNSNFSIMLRHSLLISFRNFKRYKSSFFINMIGLSSGLTCALLIFLWVQDEMGVDKFHENDNRLYQVREKVELPHMTLASRSISGPLEEGWRTDMPEVEYIVTTSRDDEATLAVKENNIRGSFKYASRDFFNVFSFSLIHGHKDNVLNDKNSVVISQDMAGKLFPTLDNAVGQIVKFDRDKDYRVSGIFKTLSKNSTQQFDFILPIEVLKDQQKDRWNWNWHALRAFVLLKPGVEVSAFNEKIKDYIQVKTNGAIKSRKPFVTSFSDTYLYGDYENGIEVGGRIEYVRLFSFVAIFILLIACINFMNLSTARASIRIKEVGIKKTLGVRRKTLIFQYLGESLLLASISLVVALLLTIICLPEFNVLTDKQLTLVFDENMALGLFSIIIITGIVAGAYPAFYLSRFNAVSVLKGKLDISFGEIWTRRGLVVFQFVLTIILVSSVLVVYEQLEMMQSKNLGYDKDQIIQFKREGKLNTLVGMETFLDEVRNISGVSNASGLSRTIIGRSSVTFPKWEGQPSEDKTFFALMRVNYDFIETVGIEMKEGRAFSKSYSSDDLSVILNEEAVKTMGLKDPIGKTVKLGLTDLKIIGVTKDFHLASLHKKVEPLLFLIMTDWIDNFMVKLEAGKEKETIDKLKEFYEHHNSGFSFDYSFLDQEYQAQYGEEMRVSFLAKCFAGIAILISCLGLFGLVSFTAERRMKEIGIRKILGSSVVGIIYMLSIDFTKIVLAAILIAIPLSYGIASNWLDDFAYRIILEWWFFAVSGLLALIISWTIVGWQAMKVANTNPAKCLRDE